MRKKNELHGAARRIYGGLYNRISGMLRFGQSKHDAKAAARAAYLKKHGNLKGYNPAKVDGIYSIRTAQTYRAAMEKFSEWLGTHGVKNAAQVTPELAEAYLRERAETLSAWTVSRDASAINKVLGYNLSKKELGLNPRRKQDITRNRNATANDRRDFSAYKEQTTIVKATGIRRESMTVIAPKDCVRNAAGQVVGIKVTEKGGKFRVAPVLNVYKDIVTAIVNQNTVEPDKPLFSSYDRHIDNHHFRAQYCANLLRQLSEEHAEGKPWFGGDLVASNYINLSKRDRNRGDTYRGYPTKVVAAVSGAMGHNRLEVIFSHYNYAH